MNAFRKGTIPRPETIKWEPQRHQTVQQVSCLLHRTLGVSAALKDCEKYIQLELTLTKGYPWKADALRINKVKPLSCVQLFLTPWTVAYQAPPSMGFSRQEYWSGLPFPSPGDLPDQGLNPGLQHCRQILYPLSHLVAQRVKTSAYKQYKTV